MQINDIGKMFLLGLCIVSVSIGRFFTDDFTNAGYFAVMGPVVGYLIGNGVNALRGVPGSPALISKGSQPALVVQPGGSSMVARVPDEGPEG